MERILWKIGNYFKSRFSLAVLDETTGRWPVSSSPKNIPYLKAENAGGRHILLKPDPVIQPYYFLADDLDIDLLIRHHQSGPDFFKPGRMVIETSPGNYQVWIHSARPLNFAEKRYWLEKLHSDPGADPKNRWGRCPGFRNRKAKHRMASGQYPLAKLIWVDWNRQADIPKIELSSHTKKTFSHQPRGECVITTILPDPFIIKVMNLPLILHMLWPFIGEDLPELKSTIVLSRKGRIGVTMPALGKEHNI